MRADSRVMRRRGVCALAGVAAASLTGPWRGIAAVLAKEGNANVVSASEELKLLGPRLVAILRRHANLGYTPGAVVMVARGDATQQTVAGDQARGPAHTPVRMDSIFRISSMTKPITAAAAMMLVEEGHLRLRDPIDRWIPELANRQVLRAIDAELDDTVPARRPITLEDLLTFRCGLGMVSLLAAPDTYPIQRKIAELELVGFGAPDPASALTPDEWLKRLGTLPLMAQPGEQWLYNTGSSILGVLLARVAGAPLPELLRRRVFEPLGMKDTGFYVPASQLSRLVSAYRLEAGRVVLYDAPGASAWQRPPAFPDGGAGLVSTAEDYLAFSRFLLARGRIVGQTLLPAAAVDTMTRDQLTASQRASGAAILGDGRGWGFGMSVVVDPHAAGLPAGSYGWNGGLGSSWVADPHSGRTVIVLTETMFSSPAPPALHQEIWRAVFAPSIV
jgi:CubicO group peptidase (beta-lactamase class C family)